MTTPAITPSLPTTPKWLVAAPDGKTIQFPDSFQQGDVEREMNTMYPTGYQGPLTSTGIAAPQGTSTASEAWKSIKKTAGDLATGASEGAANTVGSSIVGTAKLLNKIPFLGKYLAPQEGIDALAAKTAERSAPENTTQAVGRGAEQIGEFMLPGVGEEGAVAHTLPFLSRLGRLAKPLARIAYQAGTTGAVNAAQGGSPTAGAAAGAIGGGLGEGLRAVAPAVAESALGITKRMRGYGKTPGVAALEETSALRPAAIERQAQQKIGQLTDSIETSANAHPGTVSLQPAIDTIDQEIAKATSQNNGQAIEQLGRVKDALTKGAVSGNALAPDQAAGTALNMKRGLRNQFVKNWNPELMTGTRQVAARASGAIDSELDNALGPDFQSTNQRISSLVPVAERSESLARDPGIAQRVGNRVAAHTGALIGSAALGTEGYRRGGIPGAIGGAISGAVLPEILASPASQMAAARIAYKPGAFLRLLNGAGLQLDRGSNQ